MKIHPGSARVMVSADSLDDASQVLRQLKEEFGNLRLSTNPDLAVQDFETFKPDVLVLAFDSLDKAQRYYLGLYRLSRLVHQQPHRTVILCNKEEVWSAAELCRKEYFDDYVLYWPHAHDGPRLTMSIWMASREMMVANSAGPSTGDLRSHTRQLGELEQLLDAQLADGQRQIAAVRQSMSRGGLDSMDSWARRFKDQLEPALAGTRVLTEKVSKIRWVVMVVDDDDFTRRLIDRSLDLKTYETVFAGDGIEALSLLRRARPDIILMDVRLPGQDGVSLTHQIKAAPHLADIPIIMMTGDARRETLLSSMEAGAAAFVVKPFTRESLTANLERVLAR